MTEIAKLPDNTAEWLEAYMKVHGLFTYEQAISKLIEYYKENTA